MKTISEYLNTADKQYLHHFEFGLNKGRKELSSREYQEKFFQKYPNRFETHDFMIPDDLNTLSRNTKLCLSVIQRRITLIHGKHAFDTKQLLPWYFDENKYPDPYPLDYIKERKVLYYLDRLEALYVGMRNPHTKEDYFDYPQAYWTDKGYVDATGKITDWEDKNYHVAPFSAILTTIKDDKVVGRFPDPANPFNFDRKY